MLLYLWMMVQIIGECLPISSSGHVELVQKIMVKYGHYNFSMSHDFLAFDNLLQGVSAIIFFFYFFPLWWKLIVDKPMKIASLFDTNLWIKNIAPVFLFGCGADSMTFLLWYLDIAHKINVPLGYGCMMTGVALWSLQFAHEKKDRAMWSLQSAFIVGFVQGCALFPGISRFGTTMAALQWLGYAGHNAFAISFLLQWPLIIAGGFLGLHALQGTLILKNILTLPFLMIMIMVSFSAYLLLGYVKKIIDKNLLWKFSYYMIIPSIIGLLI